ncbi:unnamed protein product [Pseudo-nitzschia multistriata]|uniref:F-box domain-containing protein n=1 Tax=Pseudo-nitzschia multistriata TaxID=183589 RepID=A0A448ZLB8_9STRA|nr:unnamed protein product [Pseudo-nitzschia multistriata]
MYTTMATPKDYRKGFGERMFLYAVSEEEDVNEEEPSSESCNYSPSPSLFSSVPSFCRLGIFDFLESEDLVSLTLVSKSFCADCQSSFLKSRIVPEYEISPRPYSKSAPPPLLSLLKHLLEHQSHESGKFSRYPRVRVHKIDQFYGRGESRRNAKLHKKILAVVDKLTATDDRQHHWSTLDLSLKVPTELPSPVLPLGLAAVFPGLREIDLTNIVFPTGTDFAKIFDRLPFLGKIVWNNSRGLYLMGWHLPAARSKDGSTNPNYHLKELILDDSEFNARDIRWVRAVSDIGNSNNDEASPSSFFLFHSCCGEGLEGLSIRNARCYTGKSIGNDRNDSFLKNVRKRGFDKPIPQTALIKFVRNAPSTLKWFRSDLTTEHKVMLRAERPEIELL